MRKSIARVDYEIHFGTEYVIMQAINEYIIKVNMVK